MKSVDAVSPYVAAILGPGIRKFRAPRPGEDRPYISMHARPVWPCVTINRARCPGAFKLIVGVAGQESLWVSQLPYKVEFVLSESDVGLAVRRHAESHHLQGGCAARISHICVPLRKSIHRIYVLPSCPQGR